MTHKLPNGEWHVEWTCPGCNYKHHDSVHVKEGPWISCTCEQCGQAFSDSQLDSASLASWDAARDAADAEAETLA